MTRASLAIALALGTAACALAPASPQVAMFKSLEGRQCESVGRNADDVAAELTRAGIEVIARSCGHDGRMRPQMCGAADGRIVIVEVPASNKDAATALGFAPLSLRPDAIRAPCR